MAAIVTGSAGLVGSAVVKRLLYEGLDVVGIDNDTRKDLFGPEASTAPMASELRGMDGYTHVEVDIRNAEAMSSVFSLMPGRVDLVVHTASQPSHDWAARHAMVDFDINAVSTLRLLELVRHRCPDAVFAFCSTNKVYGDNPNRLPLQVRGSRFDLPKSHKYYDGVDESMSLDNCLHSLFGVSKTAADLMVQEYGWNFGIRTVSFRCGCITGAGQSGALLHGFLSYMARCFRESKRYVVIGYNGLQVRDNLHAEDLADAIWRYYKGPDRYGAVYNMGGGRENSCSVLEALELMETLYGRGIPWVQEKTCRVGDHKWWITDTRAFERDYPEWARRYSLQGIMEEMLWLQDST